MSRVLADTPVHERILRYCELDRIDGEFAKAIGTRFPGVDFTLEMRPHPNQVLNAAGDRLRVAMEVAKE